MKKVLFISHGHPDLSPGGAERAAFNLYKALYSNEELDPCFLAAVNKSVRPYAKISTRNNSPTELLVHFPPIDYFNFMSESPNELKGLAEEIIDYFRPDIIHIHHFVNIGLDVIPIFRSLLPGVKIVLTLHEYLLVCHNYGQMLRTDGTLCRKKSYADCAACRPEAAPGDYFLRESYIKGILRLVDVIHAPSHFLVKQFLQNGFGEFSFKVIENLQLARQSLPTVKGDPDFMRVGYFGQINKFKGTNVLVSAALELKKRSYKKIFFDVFGSIYKGMDPDFERDFEANLSAAKEVVNFRGRYDGSEVVDLMSGFDVVVVPSIWWENSPLVIQEAISAGVYLLGSDIGGVREKVLEYDKGYLFKAGDHFDLANKLMRLHLELNSDSKSSSKVLEDDCCNPTDEYIKLYKGLL